MQHRSRSTACKPETSLNRDPPQQRNSTEPPAGCHFTKWVIRHQLNSPQEHPGKRWQELATQRQVASIHHCTTWHWRFQMRQSHRALDKHLWLRGSCHSSGLCSSSHHNVDLKRHHNYEEERHDGDIDTRSTIKYGIHLGLSTKKNAHTDRFYYMYCLNSPL